MFQKAATLRLWIKCGQPSTKYVEMHDTYHYYFECANHLFGWLHHINWIWSRMAENFAFEFVVDGGVVVAAAAAAGLAGVVVAAAIVVAAVAVAEVEHTVVVRYAAGNSPRNVRVHIGETPAVHN